MNLPPRPALRAACAATAGGQQLRRPDMPTTKRGARLRELLTRHRDEILQSWLDYQARQVPARAGTLDAGRLAAESDEFLEHVVAAVDAREQDIEASAWAGARQLLDELSRTRAEAGFSPAETATFVLSLKRPLFDLVRREFARDPEAVGDELWSLTELLDRLALHTTDAYLRNREAVIRRQQDEILELSTPVIRVWDGILAVPLIGTLDSARAQTVMESLLELIVESESQIAIIDITGVPTVDTLVAQHLLKTVAAARLMGAECIISGIRPQIAQTIVHLGLDLGDVATRATLADALQLALSRRSLKVTPAGAPAER
jgi:rsbT co-antagonist protein RsbR